MTLAGIELRYLVNYISKKTLDYYVSNIYGINTKSLLFKLHHPEKPDVLLMFSTMGLWATSKKVEQIETNRLLKRLRSDLLRFKLTKPPQHYLSYLRVLSVTQPCVFKEVVKSF